MERVLRYMITEDDEGLRIEQYLKQRGYSRQCLIHLKKHPGSVLADGVSRFLNQPLAAGEQLIIRFCEEESSAKIPPVEIPLNIVYEDEDLLVINKPAGMPIHPSMNNYTNSMANGLAWYYAQQGKAVYFPVHQPSGPGHLRSYSGCKKICSAPASYPQWRRKRQSAGNTWPLSGDRSGPVRAPSMLR